MRALTTATEDHAPGARQDVAMTERESALDEYRELANHIRFYGNPRFAQLTVFLAITGLLLGATINAGGGARHLLVIVVPAMGLVVHLLASRSEFDALLAALPATCEFSRDSFSSVSTGGYDLIPRRWSTRTTKLGQATSPLPFQAERLPTLPAQSGARAIHCGWWQDGSIRRTSCPRQRRSRRGLPKRLGRRRRNVADRRR
jgi:hypothetical protein